MRPSFALLLLGGLVLAGCKDKPVPPKLPQLGAAFPTLLLPPAARFVSQQGSADALQLSFASDLPADQVATYYRNALIKEPWRLVSDTKDSTGAIVLYAEDGKQPLWIQIGSDATGRGSTVDMSGAVVARAHAAKPDSARPDSVKPDSARPDSAAATTTAQGSRPAAAKRKR